jgi:hypothetical protein
MYLAISGVVMPMFVQHYRPVWHCEGGKANGSDEDILRNIALIEEANGVAAICECWRRTFDCIYGAKMAMKLLFPSAESVL